MLQAIILKWALDAVIEIVIEAAEEKVADTENDLDDVFVAQLKNNKDLIKNVAKGKLK